jgi:hypothetical protein
MERNEGVKGIMTFQFLIAQGDLLIRIPEVRDED